MNNYKPLDNLVNNAKCYIKNNPEKIWKGVKYGMIFPTAFAVGLSGAPKIQDAISRFIPSLDTNVSQSIAAEIEQPYQIFKPHIDMLDYVNKNMWNMEQEKEFKNDPRFQNLKDNVKSLLGYPNANHAFLMDLPEINSIKFKPDGTKDGYSTFIYVGNILPENAIKAGEIFNIPDGANIEEYMNSIFDDAFYIGNKHKKMIEKRENEAAKRAKENQIIETRQNVISAAQKEKQKSIDNYVSGNLDSISNSIELNDLKGFEKTLNVYRAENSDEMLSKLGIPGDAIISYTEFERIDIYNVVLDYDDLDDGRIKIIKTTNGFKSLFDVPGAPQGRKGVSIIKGSRLEKLVTTDDAGAFVSNILTDEEKDHYILRDLEDGEPSFGIIDVPKDMKVKVGEILADESDGVDNDVISDQNYNGAIFEFPAVVRDKDGGSDTPITPIPPYIPPEPPDIPQPSPEQELNDDNDPQDSANTGCDPNAGEGSTQTNPVVNPDPDPHVF
jgi:hypothetical protein